MLTQRGPPKNGTEKTEFSLCHFLVFSLTFGEWLGVEDSNLGMHIQSVLSYH